MAKWQVPGCVKLEGMSQVDLRERLVQVTVAQCVVRCVALVAGTETEEGGVSGSVRIGKRLAILIARLEAETSRHSATNFDHACVKPALLGVVKLEAETECGWAVVEEVDRATGGGAVRTLVIRQVRGKTNHVRIGSREEVDERR